MLPPLRSAILTVMIKLILILAFASFAHADPLTTSWSETGFSASLKEGFHFNEQAPNQLTVNGVGLKPTKSSPRALEFISASKFKSARASVYVCDDALTFCRPNTFEYNGGGVAKSDVDGSASSKITRNEFGFIEDNLKAAVDQAAREKKLVLIDVSARWCPGCVRLENEIFGKPAFRAAAKKFVTVRLDFDRFENLELAKKKYDVRAIPSLIVIDGNQEEISRLVDFQPMPVVTAFLKDASKTPVSLSKLESDPKAALTVGRRLYSSAQYEKAVTALSKVQPPPVELLDARVQAAKGKPEFQKVVRDAIAAEPASSRSIVWRTMLVESLDPKDAEVAKIASEGLSVGERLLAAPKKLKEATRGDLVGEFAGYEALLVASERADLAEAAHLDESAQQAALTRVVEIGRALKIPVSKKGPALRYLIFLVAAKQFDEAETQARALLKKDPSNPEIQRRLLRVLNGQKKFTEAIPLGREALAHSFGKNEVWVAQQLAKAYQGAGQKLEAKALAQAYLDRKDIDWPMMKSEQKDLSEIANSGK